MKYLTIVFVIIFFSCGSDNEPEGPITNATAEIYLVSSDDGITYTPGEITGSSSLLYQDGVTTMEISVFNFEPNTSHAIHIHKGSLEVPGSHWNQGLFTPFCNERSLGNIWAKVFAGDVGNIDVDSDGNGSFTIRTDLWALGTNDEKDIQNTVIYIHENEENFIDECDPNHGHTHGHVNAKIAGGTILLDVDAL